MYRFFSDILINLSDPIGKSALIEKLPEAFLAIFVNEFIAIDQRPVAYGVPMFRAYQFDSGH